MITVSMDGDFASGGSYDAVYTMVPQTFPDARGFFRETWKRGETPFDMGNVEQANMSVSGKHVFRGMHAQAGSSCQGKLVSCPYGSVYDVIIDARRGSPTYRTTKAYLLDPTVGTMLWVPRGFLHGFVSLDDATVFQYFCDNAYDRSAECGVNARDTLLRDGVCVVPKGAEDNMDRVRKLLESAALSDKDMALPTFEEFERSVGPFGEVQ